MLVCVCGMTTSVYVNVSCVSVRLSYMCVCVYVVDVYVGVYACAGMSICVYVGTCMRVCVWYEYECVCVRAGACVGMDVGVVLA